MIRLAGLVWLCGAGIAMAQDGWRPLTGDEIRDALMDRKLSYANAWQKFSASGRTLYNAGQDSWG